MWTADPLPDKFPVIVRDEPEGEAHAILVLDKGLLEGLAYTTLLGLGYMLADSGWLKDIMGPSPKGVWCCEWVKEEEYETCREFGFRDITEESLKYLDRSFLKAKHIKALAK